MRDLRKITAVLMLSSCLLATRCNNGPTPQPTPDNVGGAVNSSGGSAGQAGESDVATGGTEPSSGGSSSIGGSPAKPDVDSVCKRAVALECSTYNECASALEDVIDASVNPELECLVNASSCLEMENCR